MRLRSGTVTVDMPLDELITMYNRYLSKGKFKQGRPLSLRAYAWQHVCPRFQLANTDIRVPLDVLRVQYRCKLNWSAKQNPAMHTRLLQPITPSTLSTLVRPYTCDPCDFETATQALNRVRTQYVARPNGSL